MFICTGDVYDPATIALRESFAEKYGINITDGWIVMDHWVIVMLRNHKGAILSGTTPFLFVPSLLFFQTTL